MNAYFVTELDTRFMRDGQRVLLGPLVYYSALLDRMITVPQGFVTDLASVPRLPIAYALAGGRAEKAAVVHDWLYHSHETSRKEADDVFLEAMEITGQPWWRRNLMWAAVRLFGSGPYRKEGEKHAVDGDSAGA